MLGEPWGFKRYGTLPRMSETTPPSFNERVSEAFLKIQEEVPYISKYIAEQHSYVWPSRHAGAKDIDSLCVHTNTYFKESKQAMTPDREMERAILYYVEKRYEKARWDLPKCWWSYESFVLAVRELDMTSSPGIPYIRESPTNGEWLRWNGLFCDDLQLQRLWYDVQKVIQPDYELFLRVFIKQEPHKIKKAQDKRWRLIMAAPLNVQVAWQMCFRYMNDVEIDNSYHLPSQQGLVLVNGGWKTYHSQWKSMNQTCGMDKSAWDWTAPRWTLALDLELRKRLCRTGMNEAWIQVAETLYHQMFDDAILVMSDGSAYQQVEPGIMKSGCVNTISTNSHCQVFIHCAIALMYDVPLDPMPRCVGDDTLCTPDQSPPGIFQYYSSLGVILKSISDTTEFVGREFRDDGPYPMYIGKHVVKAMHVKDENLSMYLDSMAREYCHSDEYYEVWRLLAETLNCPLPLSREAYLYWYDHPVA